MTEIDKALDVITDEIIKTNESYYKKRTRFERCSVETVNSDGTYCVRYDKHVYKTSVLNGISLKRGDVVMMVIPDNNISKRFILGKL